MRGHVVLIALGTLFILGHLVSVVRPRLAWRMRLYGTRWEYAEPDRLKPSAARLATTRVTGTLGVIFGIVLVTVGVIGVVRQSKVDTAPGTVGGQAVQLDRAIRHLAASTGGDTREPALADNGISQVAHDVAVSECRKRAGTTSASPRPSPQPRPSRPAPIVSPLDDACVPAAELAAAERMTPALDYQTTGHITISSDLWVVVDAQEVCLTVSQDPTATGKITVGSCPGG